jgi:hypothetical protein
MIGPLVFIFSAAAFLVVSAQPMLMFVQKWDAKEEGSLYDLTLTGLTAMSSMVFVIGFVIIIYVGIRLGKIFKV